MFLKTSVDIENTLKVDFSRSVLSKQKMSTETPYCSNPECMPNYDGIGIIIIPRHTKYIGSI